jgi:hypothetical protein
MARKTQFAQLSAILAYVLLTGAASELVVASPPPPRTHATAG